MISEAWELGEPLTYKALGPDATPLSRATIWPDDMDEGWAETCARMLEIRGARLIGARLDVWISNTSLPR